MSVFCWKESEAEEKVPSSEVVMAVIVGRDRSKDGRGEGRRIDSEVQAAGVILSAGGSRSEWMSY